jgi:hypothetical protein
MKKDRAIRAISIGYTSSQQTDQFAQVVMADETVYTVERTPAGIFAQINAARSTGSLVSLWLAEQRGISVDPTAVVAINALTPNARVYENGLVA